MAFSGGIENYDVTRPDQEGRVTLRFQERILTIRFGWAQIHALQQAWGDDFMRRASQGMDGKNLECLSEIVAASADLTPKQAAELDMPIVAVADACAAAWKWAWFGGEPPDQGEAAEPEKPRPRVTLLGWRLRLPFERV